MSWTIINILYLFIGTWLTGQKVMDFAGWVWLRRSVSIPLVATLVPALLGAWICRTLTVGPWGSLGIGAVAASAGIALGLAGSFAAGEFRRVVDMALGRQTLAERGLS